jgi:ferritin-like metal-binding protein YciE
MIRDIIILDADPELFLEKTLDDIYFSDHTLRTLLGFILENSQLIEKDELLEHLREAEWQFSQVLESLLNHDGNISIREIPSIREKLITFKNSSLERRKTAEDMSPSEDLSGNPIVSSDELTELLKAY